MISFCTKHLLRWSLIATVVVGGATFLVGPDRIAAGFQQVRTIAGETIDDLVDDPVALRRQLEGLAEQYPDRIGEVKGELAEVEGQLRELEQDSLVADRVVELTTRDLGALKSRLAGGGNESVTGHKVLVGHDAGSVAPEQLRSEGRRIVGIRAAYRDRIEGNRQQSLLLERQRQRLQDILGRLEAEYGEFEAKLWQLDRQIDSIERNERLIAMTREQQAMLDEFEKLGKVGNLRQLEAKLSELRTTQEAQLQTLELRGVRGEYEQRALEAVEVDRSGDEESSRSGDLAWLD